MRSILKGDLYRIFKSKLLYFLMGLISLIAISLTMLIRQDIHFGISVFGDLTSFKSIDEIIRIGVSYYKGIGIFLAIFISIFISNEYLWSTWQHKWIISKSRTFIYISKSILSSALSVISFLMFQFVVLLCSGQMGEVLTKEYLSLVIGGMFIYATLGAVLCMFSMLIKNSTAAIIISLCYVVFSETMISLIKNISHFSNAAEKAVAWMIQHSLYGMQVIVSSDAYSSSQLMGILINSFVIIFATTTIGVIVFRKYEL